MCDWEKYNKKSAPTEAVHEKYRAPIAATQIFKSTKTSVYENRACIFAEKQKSTLILII